MAKVRNNFRQARSQDFPYFRRLWGTIVLALLIASLIPMGMIGGGMYYYAFSALREKTIQGLRSEIQDHKEALDAFLKERIEDLRLLSANLDPESLSVPGALRGVFQSLQQALPCYTDIGVIDANGRHLAYVGPYELMSKEYRDEAWFKATMGRGTFISDVYEGFRKEPHFVIAVKNSEKERGWILRATVDTAYFDNVVLKVIRSADSDAFLVNQEGLFQNSPRLTGRLMGQSGFKNMETFEGVRVREENDGRIVLMTWLENVPWLLVAHFHENDICGSIRHVRKIGLYVFVMGGVLIVLTVLFSTNYLVSALENKRLNIHRLDHQLRRAARVASTVQLADGFMRDIRERMTNIELVIKWVGDLMQKGAAKESMQRELEDSLNQIRQEVGQTRVTAEKFFKATRPALPIVKDIAINEILEDVLELMEREIHFRRISVERDYQDKLPPVQGDPSEMRQVFQNLILNAIHAVEKGGRIVLKTRVEQGDVVASVEDNGRGMTKELSSQIFDPLFTTQSGGTGLGLSICADIIEGLGGHISVKSEAGKGTTFTVRLHSR